MNRFCQMYVRRNKQLRFLSRRDIENISERIIKAYRKLPDLAGKTIYKILPDKLITDLLGLKLEYHHLSLDGSVLGLTTPFSNVQYKVFDFADEESYCTLDGKTILIEKDLNADVSQVGRCNFTKTHEAGHQILKMLFPNDYGRSFKRIHFYLSSQPPSCKTIDWIEWQANGIASAILMPKEIIKQAMFLFSFGEKINIINKVYATKEYEQFSAMANFLGVSKTALSIRLSQLGLIERNYFNNPYDLTNAYYDGGVINGKI